MDTLDPNGKAPDIRKFVIDLHLFALELERRIASLESQASDLLSPDHIEEEVPSAPIHPGYADIPGHPGLVKDLKTGISVLRKHVEMFTTVEEAVEDEPHDE